MNVIEGYIQRKPIFLEWLHGQLSIDALGTPIGFSDRFHSIHMDTVKVWILTMHALCGDMYLQGVDNLNLASFSNVSFPSHFKECFTLSRLWLPNRFSGDVPNASMCWIYSSNLDLVDDKRFQECEWTLVLDGPPSIFLQSKDVTQIRGVDATHISSEVWREWCVVLKTAPIRHCAFPQDIVHWDAVPNWSSTLKVFKMPASSALFDDSTWSTFCKDIEVLCLRNESRTWHKWSDQRGEGLRELPKDLYHLQQLRWLDVSMNCIHQIPEQLQDLQTLQVLNLAHTDLDEFPRVLFALSALRQLFIRNTNASSTREWLNILSSQNRDLSINRVVNHQRLSLWELCLISESVPA